MRRQRWLAQMVVLLVVGLALACRSHATVRVSGSSALSPLLNAAKERFEAQQPGVSVEVSAGGSQKGLADVASGAVEIGASDIEPPPELRHELVDHRVAIMGIAAMAHRGPYDEKLTALSVRDLARIFSGQVRDWQEVGGEPHPIVVINRPPGSGTRAVFSDVVLGSAAFVESRTEDNSGALIAKLKQTDGAISYLALAYRDDSLVTFGIRTPARVIMPTPANITNGDYPLWTFEHLYTRRRQSPSTRAFLDYVLGEEFQRSLPSLQGFLPVSAMPGNAP